MCYRNFYGWPKYSIEHLGLIGVDSLLGCDSAGMSYTVVFSSLVVRSTAVGSATSGGRTEFFIGTLQCSELSSVSPEVRLMSWTLSLGQNMSAEVLRLAGTEFFSLDIGSGDLRVDDGRARYSAVDELDSGLGSSVSIFNNSVRKILSPGGNGSCAFNSFCLNYFSCICKTHNLSRLFHDISCQS